MPSTTVSRGAVNVAFEIGCPMRTRFRNRYRLREFKALASDSFREKLWLYDCRRSGLPADSASGLELSTTSCNWLMEGGPVEVLHASLRLSLLLNVAESLEDGS